MKTAPFVVALLLSLQGSFALAHEYWIEPQDYQVEKSSDLIADLRNGQEFKGVAQAFFPQRNTRFDIAMGDEITPVEGRLGDRPALKATAPDHDALLAILHEAAPSKLTYNEWDKFLKFAKHKNFATAAADHEAAGWSTEKFGESYTRHSKALVAVGTGVGADRAFGMETEFVALTNPYEASFNNQMKVRVLYKDAPRPDAQIEVFDRDGDDHVTITLHRTDANGEAMIPVTSGHTYLFDAVVLRPAAGAGSDEKAPVWETLWAALTFAVPQ